jgi:LacI family transcriptional regulator
VCRTTSPSSLGSTAAGLLLDVIADPEASEIKHVTLKPELVVRRSTVI